MLLTLARKSIRLTKLRLCKKVFLCKKSFVFNLFIFFKKTGRTHRPKIFFIHKASLRALMPCQQQRASNPMHYDSELNIFPMRCQQVLFIYLFFLIPRSIFNMSKHIQAINRIQICDPRSNRKPNNSSIIITRIISLIIHTIRITKCYLFIFYTLVFALWLQLVSNFFQRL